ncbi:hypothetical protein BU17DRAFT_56516, partial [Hysterangium stoloniferum]
VGDRLFRVPKYMLLASSPIFSTMFSLPHGPNDSAEGQCDEKPVRLEQVDPKAFKTLLSLFYPLSQNTPSPNDEWLLILSLAKEWDMGSIVDLAVNNLQESDCCLMCSMSCTLFTVTNNDLVHIPLLGQMEDQ